MSDDRILHNQRQTCRLLGISVQAFTAWGLTPDETRGTEKLYDWRRVQRVAEKKRAARPSNLHLVQHVADGNARERLQALPGGGNLLRFCVWIYHTQLARAQHVLWKEYLANEGAETLKLSRAKRQQLTDCITSLNPVHAETFLRDVFDETFEQLTGTTLDAVWTMLTHDDLGPTTWPPEDYEWDGQRITQVYPHRDE